MNYEFVPQMTPPVTRGIIQHGSERIAGAELASLNVWSDSGYEWVPFAADDAE